MILGGDGYSQAGELLFGDVPSELLKDCSLVFGHGPLIRAQRGGQRNAREPVSSGSRRSARRAQPR